MTRKANLDIRENRVCHKTTLIKKTVSIYTGEYATLDNSILRDLANENSTTVVNQFT